MLMKNQWERLLRKVKKYNTFISFEGIDGSGKSTLINKIYQYFIEKNIDVFLTKEPGSDFDDTLQNLRKLIMENEMSPKLETLLFYSSRYEHINKYIKPKLEEGKIVITDRFSDSTYVYQLLKGVEKEFIDTIDKNLINNFKPTITFLLDIDPKLSLKRIFENGDREVNRFDKEKIDFFQKAREIYLELANNDTERFFVINANKDINEIKNEIINILEEKLWKL